MVMFKCYKCYAICFIIYIFNIFLKWNISLFWNISKFYILWNYQTLGLVGKILHAFEVYLLFLFLKNCYTYVGTCTIDIKLPARAIPMIE